MLLLLAAALAAEPVLGPTGWTHLGPFPPGTSAREEGEPARDAVYLDPTDCSVEVERVDLDAGPGHREVRLARVWAGDAWAWADDWRVRDGRLWRPGRAPIRAAGWADGWRYEADAEGRVVRRSLGARRIEILHEGDRFVGMREGAASVSLVDGGARGVAHDGRLVLYRWRDGWLDGVVDAFGIGTTYLQRDGLLGVLWADGGAVAFDDGIRGAGGSWRCTIGVLGTEIVGPGGARWVVRPGEVVDPVGITVRSGPDGWYDPRGGTTRIERDGQGRPKRVVGPDGVVWTLRWSAFGLDALVGPDGAWEIERDSTGRARRLIDPSGRESAFARAADGGLTGVARNIGARTWEVGPEGVTTRILDPGGGEVRIVRDPVGRVERIVDPSGAAWTLERDARGLVVGLADPAGGRWSLARDRMGRASGVVDPAGRSVEWTRRLDGRLETVTTDGRARWELVRSVSGELTSLRDPLGRRWGWTRDLAGRVFRVARPDGTVWSVPRDLAGEIAGVDGLLVERGPTGLPRRASAPGVAERVWTWGAGGRLGAVTAPGIALGFAWDAAGALASVRIGPHAEVTLDRDAAGRVLRVRSAGADLPRGAPVGTPTSGSLSLTRDAAGRITGWRDAGGRVVALGRDLRGLVTQVRRGDRLWTLRRDATGRPLAMEGPEGLRVGADRDAAGRMVVGRFSSGELARLVWRLDGADVAVADAGGDPLAVVGWAWDRLGRLTRLGRAADPLLLARDPLGALVAVEGRAGAWSVAPGRIEGPGFTWTVDPTGRAVAGVAPSVAWGLSGELRGELGEDGALSAVLGDRRVELVHDAAGRLVAWGPPEAPVLVERDPLGRIVAVGGRSAFGWEGLLEIGGAPRVGLAELFAWAGGGVLLDPRGTPLYQLGAPDAAALPSGLPVGGLTGERGAGGSFQPVPGGPLFGLTEALDPLTGQPTAAPAGWPWESPRWEARVDASPWPDPDAASRAPWDPSAFAPVGPWGDPLRLLVEAGEIPTLAAELGATEAPLLSPVGPGLPWLPASLLLAPPAPIPEPDRLVREEDPLVLWVLAHATPPVRPAAPRDLAAFLLRAELRAELALGPATLRDGSDDLLDAMGL